MKGESRCPANILFLNSDPVGAFAAREGSSQLVPPVTPNATPGGGRYPASQQPLEKVLITSVQVKKFL